MDAGDVSELDGMAALAEGISARRFPHTMDALEWAKEWDKTIKENPLIPFDQGTMVAWFANAIMAGYDTAMLGRKDAKDA